MPSGDQPLLNINQWGRIVWGAGDIYIQTYPWKPTLAQQQEATELFKPDGWYTKFVVCPECKRHYNTYAGTHPPPVAEGREDLARWFIDVHNQVNIRNEKPRYTIEEYNERYYGPYWREIYKQQQLREGFTPKYPILAAARGIHTTSTQPWLIILIIAIVLVVSVLALMAARRSRRK